jgi:murein DD-endopeptidase MepM/ murein hydrolase activator NlpD
MAFLVAPRPALPASRAASNPRPALPASRASNPRPGLLAARAAPAPHPRPGATWRWPLRGRVVGAFRLTPRTPFARGQRRGIDVVAVPGSTVRAACPGRVTFAGQLPRQGLAVTVRCGALVATYLRLARLDVRRGTRVRRGKRLGALGRVGRLRLGARRAGDRRGYLDPLMLLRDPAATAPPLGGPAPRGRRPRPRPLLPPTRFATPHPRPAAHGLPWPAYPAVALIAAAFPVGGLLHRRRRRATTSAVVAHEDP